MGILSSAILTHHSPFPENVQDSSVDTGCEPLAKWILPSVELKILFIVRIFS